MTWQGRTTGRPHDRAWQRTRQRILDRDGHRCHVCGQPGADQVDHLVNLEHGGSHDDTNLAAIHADPCHKTKTQAEARRARAGRDTSRLSQRRTPERHPGLA